MPSKNNVSRVPIAVVGNVNLDIRTSPLRASERLFEDGETSAGEIYESLGGGAANVAVAAAQLGGCVHFCGCVGADDLGDRIESALAGFGVAPHLRRKETATGRSINLNWTNHRRHFVSSLPNNRVLAREDINVPELYRAGCRQLYRGDIWFSESMLGEGNAIVLKQARELGMITFVDINWDPEWSVPNNGVRVAERISHALRMLPYVSCVQCNESELTRF